MIVLLLVIALLLVPKTPGVSPGQRLRTPRFSCFGDYFSSRSASGRPMPCLAGRDAWLARGHPR